MNESEATMTDTEEDKKYRFMDWEKPFFVIRDGKFRPLEECVIEYVDLNQSHLFTEVT